MCYGSCEYENSQGECGVKGKVPSDAQCLSIQCEICTNIYDSDSIFFEVDGTVYCDECYKDFLEKVEDDD